MTDEGPVRIEVRRDLQGSFAPLAVAVKPIYTASSAEAAEAALDDFERGELGRRYPTLVKAWRTGWDRVIPSFAFSSAVRRVTCTTNAIESANARLCKIIKTRGPCRPRSSRGRPSPSRRVNFPHDDDANKLVWLALRNITAEWKRPSQGWREAMNQFAILYAERSRGPRRKMIACCRTC